MLNCIIKHTVKFLKTTNTRIKDMNAHQAEVYLKNEPAVQNHIGGIHAAAMVLLAETATGMVLGVSLPDDKIPLAKSIQVDFKKMTKGDLKAIARMTDAQIKRIQEDEKGEVDVEVKILDSEGLEPLVAKVVWAWIPKKS
ncbi:MAG: DUF4442 domain-containing protein [Bacteroidota bacterium]